VVHLKPSFNTFCLRFFHSQNILLEFLKVLWRINEVQSLKNIDPFQKECFVVVDLLWWKKWLTYWGTRHANYQHELWMKKGRTFNASIKCSNELKTSNKEQSKESNRCETMNTWRLRLYIKESFKIWDTNHLCELFFHSLLGSFL